MEFDINKYKETLENLKFCGYTYKSIYEKIKNNEKNLDEDNRIIIRDNIIVVKKINDDEHPK